MSARRNVLLFLPYQIASLEALAHGLYVVWLVQEKRLTAEVVALLLAAGDAALMLLEVPTGRLADRFGHRGSLIAGSVAQVAGMGLLWLGEGLIAMACASLLIALGDAFRSGADEALLYRSCQQMGKTSLFQRLFAGSRAVTIAVMAGLIVLGGRLAASMGSGFTLGAETALCAVGLLLALCMAPVPPMEDEDEAPPARGWPGAEVLLTALVPAALAGGLLSSSELVLQATWPGGVERLTEIIAGVAVAEAVGSGLGMRGGGRGALVGMGVVALGTAAAAALSPVASVWGLALITGWVGPLRAERIQRLAREGERAQAASWAGLADTATSSLLLPLTAGIAGRSSAPVAMAVAAVALGGTWGLGAVLLRRRARAAARS